MDEILCEGPQDGELVVMVHGWPDDLHLWDDLAQHLLSTGKYRCLRMTLPGYGSSRTSEPSGPNFDELAVMIAGVIQDHQRSKNEKLVLVAHDYGAVLAAQLHRAFPNMPISKMVLLDCGPMDNLDTKLKGAVATTFMGLYYQYQNAMAYLLWRYLPLLGVPLGDLLYRINVWRFKSQYPKTNFRQSASAGYLYYHHQKNFWLDFFGLQAHPVLQCPLDAPGNNPRVPTFFAYGEQGGIGGMWSGWIAHLRRRSDSDALGLPCGHWLQLDMPNEVNSAIFRWLALPNGGKLK